jgi:hypothetical protein
MRTTPDHRQILYARDVQQLSLTESRRAQLACGLKTADIPVGDLHGDNAERDVLWDARTGQVSWQDFYQAVLTLSRKHVHT